jgi:hypothetical protein
MKQSVLDRRSRAQPPLDPPAKPRRPGALATALICTLLLAAFAVLSHFAVISKSPVYDEPLHAFSAWVQVHHADFRINPEDPPLWKYFAAIPNGASALHFPHLEKFIQKQISVVVWEWPTMTRVLYQTPGNVEASDAFINRSRDMMLVVGVLLGAVIALWSWQLGGMIAAVVATTLFAFDPNFLGHASLVKNDVAMTLAMLALVFAAWFLGRRITLARLLAVGLLCAVAVTVKFSGLLAGPILALLLLVRAILPIPWPMFRTTLNRASTRLAAAIGACILAAAISYVGIWACYQFRFRPAPAANSTLHIGREALHATSRRLELASPTLAKPTTQQLECTMPTPFVRTMLWLDHHHILPDAFCTGLLYTYQSALSRSTFLLGKTSLTGWWYYFPVAIAVKSPLALIAAALAALAIGIGALCRVGTAHLRRWWALPTPHFWTAACLILPPAIYFAAAMHANLNLGLRHIFPVYPFIFIGIGLAAAFIWSKRPRITRIAAGLLALALISASLLAFPNYIAFFNAVARPHRLHLLGDSNFDWGQDLKLVAQWQQDNPDIPLYLSYFGIADPTAYQINYTNFPGGYDFNRNVQITAKPGVLAISATNLQGIYLSKKTRNFYAPLKNEKPLGILGQTIYLYAWPPPGFKLPDNPTSEPTTPQTANRH